MNKNKTFGFGQLTLSLTVVLFFLGLFLSAFVHKSEISNLLKEQLTIAVELDTIYDTSIPQVISNYEGVKNETVVIVEAEEAKKFMDLEFGTLLLDDQTIPYRDMITFRLNASAFNSGFLEDLRAKLVQLDGVLGVFYQEEALSSIERNVVRISYVFLAIGLLFFVIFLVILHSSVRIRIEQQKSEIKTMQLVGATHSFIKRPFLQAGTRLSLISVFLAIVLLFLSHYIIGGIIGLDFSNTSFLAYFAVNICLILISYGLIQLSIRSILNRFFVNGYYDIK